MDLRRLLPQTRGMNPTTARVLIPVVLACALLGFLPAPAHAKGEPNFAQDMTAGLRLGEPIQGTVAHGNGAYLRGA